MEKKSFNLKKFLKQAFYEDVRGYWNQQTRAWQNCYKSKCNEGKGPQDAWQNCLKEFQEASQKSDWLMNYGHSEEIGKKFDARTPAAQKILKDKKD